jgi:thiol-disulfide isomerase/thioredoxin
VRRSLAAGAAVLLLLAGCTGEDETPIGGARPSQVDVDTPELRELKAEIGIEDCVPGTAADGALPDVTLACLGGGPDVDLASLEGPLVINQWFFACGPCRKEMPALQEFHERYGDRVPIIGVTNDIFPEAPLELARDTGATYPQLADPGDELSGSDIRSRFKPAFVFLHEDGEVEVVQGGIESADEMVDLVEQHLGITL